MNTDKILNEYINKEKEEMHSPFLKNRIIEQIKVDNSFYEVTLWQKLMVAASITIVAISGMLIGSMYNSPLNDNGRLSVNDSQIENFTIIADESE